MLERLIRRIYTTLKYRGMSVHSSARLAVKGRFVHSKGTSLGRNSLLQVPAGAQLLLGEGVYLGREVEVTPSSAISIGAYTTVQDRCILLGEVKIGAHCVFAPNVYISSGIHHFKVRPEWLIRDQDRYVLGGQDPSIVHHQPVSIGDDCWLGINVAVMRGVSIGRGCVVGANSVVTRPLPPYSVAAGSPARVVGQRLEFKPKTSIDAANPADLPYFYSGFDLRQASLQAQPGRVAAAGNFELALDLAQARHLKLRLSCDAAVTLQCQGQTRSLGAGEAELDFGINDGAGVLLSLAATDSAGSPCRIWLRSASVEN